MSCDPAGPQDGLNLYCFTRDNPIILIDPQGTKSKHKQETLEEKLDQVNKAIDEMQSYKMLLSWRNFSLSKADPEDKAISAEYHLNEAIINCLDEYTSVLRDISEALSYKIAAIRGDREEQKSIIKKIQSRIDEKFKNKGAIEKFLAISYRSEANVIERLKDRYIQFEGTELALQLMNISKDSSNYWTEFARNDIDFQRANQIAVALGLSIAAYVSVINNYNRVFSVPKTGPKTGGAYSKLEVSSNQSRHHIPSKQALKEAGTLSKSKGPSVVVDDVNANLNYPYYGNRFYP